MGAALACIHASFAQPACRLDGGQALVDGVDGQAGRLGERLGEGLGLACGGSGQTVGIERNADDEALEFFGFHEASELAEGAFAVASVECGAGMGHEAELVTDGEPDSNLAEVEGSDAHAGEQLARAGVEHTGVEG